VCVYRGVGVWVCGWGGRECGRGGGREWEWIGGGDGGRKSKRERHIGKTGE